MALNTSPKVIELASRAPGPVTVGRVIPNETVPRWARTSLGAIKPAVLASILKESAEEGDMERWADLAKYMVESDDHLRSVMGTRVANVTGLDFNILPSKDDDPQAAAAAEFITRAMAEMPSIRRVMADLLDAVGVGFSVAEILWTRRGSAWIAQDLVWLHPRRFQFDENWDLRLWDGGNLTDTLSPEHRYTGMPLSAYPNKFVVHFNRTSGYTDYPSRSGVLRAVAWLWMFKRWAWKYWTSGAEALANPLVIGKVPPNSPSNVRSAMLEDLELLAAHQKGVFEDGTSIEIPNIRYSDSSDVWLELIKRIDVGYSKAVLGSDANVEATTGSGQSVAESQASITISPRIQDDFRHLFATLQDQLWRPMLWFNRHLFGGVMPPVPKGEFAEPEPSIVISPELVATGSVSRNEIRRAHGLPEIPGGDVMISPTAVGSPPAPVEPT